MSITYIIKLITKSISNQCTQNSAFFKNEEKLIEIQRHLITSSQLNFLAMRYAAVVTITF